jgi:phosphatidylserine/phosphatidylglycerophosphate/cardiolipin synthase-like enzyme
MAKFIATKGISAELSEVITRADRNVILITPYVRIGTYFNEKLLAASKRGVVVKLVCRRKDLTLDQRDLLLKIPNLKLFFHDNVHSKCYYNEHMMIIGSMNFYEYSEQNNREMGIVLDRSGDAELFNAAQKESEEIIQMSELFNKPVKPLVSSQINRGRPKSSRNLLERIAGVFLHEGYCIRCKEELDMNPRYPLCPKCYKVWSNWNDPDYVEKYCHCCGESNRTSMHKPLCKDCFDTH